jgi:hypothetical protein
MTKLNKTGEVDEDEEMYGPVDIPTKPKDAIVLGNSKSSKVNHEEMILQEFKKALLKKAKMTPEEFYRTIDLQYQMCITVTVFKKKLQSYNNFDISAKNIARLICILDEDMEGNISLHEYYNALEAYDCRGEDVTPFDDDPMYANF